MDAAIAQAKDEAERNELLGWAAARGLLVDAEALLSQGAIPDSRDKQGRQPSHYAAAHGHVHILEFLSTKGVDLDLDDPSGRPPLLHAAAGGHAEAVAFLAARSCWLDATDAADDTALHIAARGGHLRVVKALVGAGAKVGLVNKRSLTPLAEAVLAGHIDIAGYLASLPQGDGSTSSNPSNGAHQHPDITSRRFRGFTLLQLAAGLGQARSVQWLLARGADVRDQGNAQGLSALHAAAMSGSTATVELLLNKGADADALSTSGQLPAQLVPTDPQALRPGSDSDQQDASSSLPPEPHSRAAALARARALRDMDSPLPSIDSLQQVYELLVMRSSKAASLPPVNKVWATGTAGGAGPSKQPTQPSRADRGAGEQQQADNTPLGRFARLSPPEQISKVESYALLPDAELKDMGHITPAALQALHAVRDAIYALNLFKAVAALREDADFQADVSSRDVQQAIDYVRKTNDAERYSSDLRVLSVMGKMKKLHGVSQMNGGRKVTIDELLASAKGNDPASTAKALAAREQAVKEAAHLAADAILAPLAATAAAEKDAAKQRQDQAPISSGNVSNASTTTTTTTTSGRGMSSAAPSAASDSGQAPAAVQFSVPPSGRSAPPAGGSATAASVAAFQRGSGGSFGRASVTSEIEEVHEDERDVAAAAAASSSSGGQRDRVSRLGAAAAAAWSNAKGDGQADDDGGDELDALGEGARMMAKMRQAERSSSIKAPSWMPGRLVKALGPEGAQQLSHMLLALLYSLLGLGIMWATGLMPHQRRPLGSAGGNGAGAWLHGNGQQHGAQLDSLDEQ